MNSNLSAVEIPARRRPWVQRLIEVGVSLVFLVLALRGINLADLWQALRHASYIWLLPLVGITVVLLILKGWRWQLLFLPEHRLPYWPVFSAMCVGYMVSNVLPARAGEAARLVLLVSDQPVSVARTFSTIVIERLLDVLSLLAVLIVLLPFISVDLPLWMARGAQFLGVSTIIGTALLIAMTFQKERLMRWTHAVFGRIKFLDKPALYQAVEHLVDGFAALRGRLGLGLFFLSFVCWLGVVGIGWAAAQTFRLQLPLPAVAFAMVVTTLGMILPSTPGYIGVFEGLAVMALAPFGVSKDLAFSYALIWHAGNYFTLTAAGAIALWVHGTSFGQLLQWRRSGVVAE